jgi:vibriolysin
MKTLRWLALAGIAVSLFAATGTAQTAGKVRFVYSANNGPTLPGVLRRSEGEGPTSDPDINATYDAMGDFYDAFRGFWNRNSYDNFGGTLSASVHYSLNFCNVWLDGTRVVLGDGDVSTNCRSPGRSLDAVVHQLMHLVTQNDSALALSGEPGALNEAMSDIFAAFVEAWVDGGRTGTLAVSADTWKVGEDVMTPSLRSMSDPAGDGLSADYWTANVGSLAPQYASGIANLAFYLLSQGGMHPRGRSTIAVPGIGMDKAIRIFYKANVDHLPFNATFTAAANATIAAAAALGYSTAEQESVASAWRAVGVSPGDDAVIALINGVTVSGLSGAAGSEKFFKLVVPAGQSTVRFTIAGGTGDADLHVRRGSRPTTTDYSCRPYLAGSNETCTFNAPAPGTYYVMLRGYTAYSAVTLVGVYSVTSNPPPSDASVANGVPITGLSGATGSQQYWRISVPAGRQLMVRISGGSGDADLYLRYGSRPTTTAYACRPYFAGNAETCVVNSTLAGDYYVMVRAYATYFGVTLVATY